MSDTDNSLEQWQQEIVERQHNLTPAEITRTSQFRASGLPRSAALPIAGSPDLHLCRCGSSGTRDRNQSSL